MSTNLGTYIQEHYNLANERYQILKPDVDYIAFEPGDVLLSRSGNTRLILKISRDSKNPEVSFLTKLSSAKLQIEQALLDRINTSRLQGVVRCKLFEPLGMIEEIVSNLSKHTEILHNVEVMLGLHPLGIRFSASIVAKNSQSELADLTMFIDRNTGKISNFNDTPYADSEILVGLLLNARNLPSFDYIRSAAFLSGTPELVKQSIIRSCILANTIQNAINFQELSVSFR